MRISHTRPAPFNFLNGTGMRIVFNKRSGVGMGTTRPVVIPNFGLYLNKRWWIITNGVIVKPKSNLFVEFYYLYLKENELFLDNYFFKLYFFFLKKINIFIGINQYVNLAFIFHHTLDHKKLVTDVKMTC